MSKEQYRVAIGNEKILVRYTNPDGDRIHSINLLKKTGGVLSYALVGKWSFLAIISDVAVRSALRLIGALERNRPLDEIILDPDVPRQRFNVTGLA